MSRYACLHNDEMYEHNIRPTRYGQFKSEGRYFVRSHLLLLIHTASVLMKLQVDVRD